MKGCINNKMGQIQIDTDVIALYAGTTAVECFGIVGMAAVSMKDGLVKLLKRESLTHGINVTINDNAIEIDFHVIVSYGVSISTVADNLIESVKYKVEEFTGMPVEKIFFSNRRTVKPAGSSTERIPSYASRFPVYAIPSENRHTGTAGSSLSAIFSPSVRPIS